MSSKQGQKSSRVPTFSSFKPKTEAAAAAAAAPANEQGKEESQPKEERSRSHRDHHHHRHSSHRQHEHNGSRSEKRSRHHEKRSPPRESLDLPQRSAAAPSETSSRDNFVIDKRGDPLIRRYGGNNRYDVPAYRRYGRGRLLGADGFVRVEQLGSRDEFTLRGFYEGGGSGSALGSRRPLAGSRRAGAEVVRVRAEKVATYTGVEDFLPLGSGSGSKKRKRPESDAGDASSDEDEEEGPSYRSIHGKSKPHEFSDSDEEYGSDPDDQSRARDLDDPIKAKTIQLSNRVRQHPQNIEGWLALVDHQDTLLHIKDRDGQRPTPAEIRSFADIKLSMLEKALSHCESSPAQREVLLLRTMTEGAKIWEAKALAIRWEDVVREHGGSSFAIWKAYVDFRQTCLSTLRYEDVKLLYVNKMRQLKAALTGQEATPDVDQELYAQLVVVFTRLTRFVAESGYRELAAASWQAILELHFCRPGTTSTAEGGDGNTTMAVPLSFQSFWESEVARIGEDSAKGWAAFEASGGTEEPPEPIAFDNNGATPNTRDPYKAWAAVEQHRGSHARVPARTMDEGTEDDPYRVVMYTDIDDLLFFAPDGALPLVQEQLIAAFLAFHQLPPAPGSSALGGLLARDGLLDTNGLIHFGDHKQDPTQTPETEGSSSNKPLEFPQSHQRISPSSEVLFPSTTAWFNYMDPAVRALTNDGQLQLLSTALKQLVRSHGRSDLAAYHLALDMCSPKTDGKKAAKALLKRYPANIELYIGYANYEFRAGNQAAGSNVLVAALQLPGLSPEEKLRLWTAWAWMALEQSDLPMSLARLCLVGRESQSQAPLAAAAMEPASPTLILKTRQALTSNCEYSTSRGTTQTGGNNSSKEPRGEGQGDIEAAMAVVAKCSDEFQSRGLAGNAGHERLLQFAAQLLYVHICHGPYRPAFLREQTAAFLGFFPDNTMFLTLFAWKETRLSIDDRVRTLLSDTLLLTKPQHDGPATRAFAIRHERRAGNAHSTRAAFEHALEDTSPTNGCCRHNVGLWISYIRHCRAVPALRPKTKDVFYRALQRCPWAKDVFLEAFGPALVRDLDSAELRSVYGTLYDKGLRVHVEMGEFVGRWKEGEKEKGRKGKEEQQRGSGSGR
ncbi:hypothetical protein PG985_009825 [Apiospora marii]|uniref:uncharacterized protein n=1 Tax=Apiospora marii TaxID=335849 RepID=UPI0031320D12